MGQNPAVTLMLVGVLSATGVGAEKPRFAAANGQREALVGQFDRVIPLIADGNGSKTLFTLTNLDSKTINVILFVSANDGSPLTLPFKDIGPNSALSGTIPVNQSVSFETDGSSASLLSGFGSLFTLDKPSDQDGAKVVSARLGGTVILHGNLPNRPSFEANATIASAYESHFTIPFDNRNNYETDIVLVNVSTQPSPVNIIVRDAAGNVLARDSTTLSKATQLIASVPASYGQTAGVSGILQISTTAIGLAGMALRVDPGGAFTTIQTMSSDFDPAAPPAPAPKPASATLPGISPTCAALEGTSLFANDGQFLGRITGNQFASDSIGNDYGLYGGLYSSTSIFNEYGRYGGTFSFLSPFNSLTTTPPVIVAANQAVAYLTVNSNKLPRVDTHAILPCLKP